jgi:hypothetical protein
MQKLVRLDKAIQRRDNAMHERTQASVDLHQVPSASNVGVNGILVSKDDQGKYSITLEVFVEFAAGLAREQLIEKLRELQALDENWE